METTLVLQIISTVAIVSGVAFGLAQLRQFDAHRRRESALELVHSYKSPEFSRGLRVLFQLPGEIDAEGFEALPEADADALMLVLSTWESLGVVVHRREMDLDLVDDFFSGAILVSWRRLGPYIRDVRRKEGRETIGEWVQWLAERMAERESVSAPVPAHLAHRDWKPRRGRWSHRADSNR